MDARTDVACFDRVRQFIESPGASHRRVTAEWLAGRLAVPLWACSASLDQLVADGVVRRHERADGAPWYGPRPPYGRAGRHVLLLGVVILAIVGVVAAGTLLRHVFYFAFGLGLGLMIAFAWLDWELNERR